MPVSGLPTSLLVLKRSLVTTESTDGLEEP
jgi:hypothetical protein